MSDVPTGGDGWPGGELRLAMRELAEQAMREKPPPLAGASDDEAAALPEDDETD